MEFRVVDKSYFAFETDLPLSSRNIHPSGVLHAFRSTPTSTPEHPNSNINGREEHSFAWINNSIHVEVAIQHLEKSGFDRSHGIVFIPYSTKRNWLDRYPHAAPALETTMETGDVVVYLNWRPYPNGLSELGKLDNDASNSEKQTTTANEADGTSVSSETKMQDADDVMPKEKSKRFYPSTIHMVRDNFLLQNAERDELHLGIYNYLFWLHDKMAAIERKEEEEEAAAMQVAAEASAPTYEEGVLSSEETETNAAAAAASSVAKRTNNASQNGVNLTELKTVVKNLESTFAIIPNVKLEKEKAGTVQEDKRVTFLEETMSDALVQIIEARVLAGKWKRRCRKKTTGKGKYADPNRRQCRVAGDFDDLFQRLVKYKEEFGNCLVPVKYKPDRKLGSWVSNLREKRKNLLKQGIEVEEFPPGKKLWNKTLTAERLEKFDSIGFVWEVAEPRVPWEDRFQELVEYYETNGRWPSQAVTGFGRWVHKQRQDYTSKRPDYMKHKAPRLDEIGFEWTPRGNTKMSWEEGFDMLMEFHRINGHFDVPSASELDKMSDERRLYKWVESLHNMYRSYKIGRKSGSLSDERVVLLIKHGFVFRNY